MSEHIQGVDVVYLHSPHRELADWYRDTLGLDQGFGDGHWQEFEVAEGSRFAIDFTGFPRSVVEKQSVVISFRVDDLDAAVEDFAEKGVRFFPSKEETIFEAGDTRIATFKDPDGNWAQLSEHGG